MEKITDIGNPVVGEVYLVPHVIFKTDDYLLIPDYTTNEVELIYYPKDPMPVYLNKHSDKENGQYHAHYHVDTRFTMLTAISQIRIDEGEVRAIEWIKRLCIHKSERRQTPAMMIAKSKLKHNCIYKGRCPHRGTDLSRAEPIPGTRTIICPLHGLMFDADTKQISTQLKL